MRANKEIVGEHGKYGNKWREDEYVLSLNLYFQTLPRERDASNDKVKEIASITGRTPESIAMRLANYSAIDPNNQIKGLNHGGPYSKYIFDKYCSDKALLRQLAEKIQGNSEKNKRMLGERIKSFNEEKAEAISAGDGEYPDISIKTKEELLKEINSYRQKGKSYFNKKGTFKQRRDSASQKEKLKQLYDYKCQVCGFSFEYYNANMVLRKYAEVDHIIDKADGGTDEAKNLWVLCSNCHAKKTLGVIKIDIAGKIVNDAGKRIEITDKHLWTNKQMSRVTRTAVGNYDSCRK